MVLTFRAFALEKTGGQRSKSSAKTFDNTSRNLSFGIYWYVYMFNKSQRKYMYTKYW